MTKNTDSEGAKQSSGQAMTPEAQRIAIAEACPELFEIHQTVKYPSKGFRTFMTRKGEGIAGEEIDPLSDLNAMHEAEKVLSDSNKISYSANLHLLVDDEHYSAAWAVIHATAAQRAEAFLRTLNLWKGKD